MFLTLPAIFTVALAIAYLVAVAFYPVLLWNRRRRRPFGVGPVASRDRNARPQAST